MTDEEFEQWLSDYEEREASAPAVSNRLRADPRLYEALDSLRAEVWHQWAPLILRARESIEACTPNSIARSVADDLFERISGEALWSCTELLKGDDYKFIAQRYLSRRVYDWWLKLAQARVSTRRQYLVGDDGRCGVRHEHVVPRANIMKALRQARKLDEIGALLAQVESCVVTKGEALELGPGEGWERYKRAGIDVWDRKKQCWLAFA